MRIRCIIRTIVTNLALNVIRGPSYSYQALVRIMDLTTPDLHCGQLAILCLTSAMVTVLSEGQSLKLQGTMS